MNIPPLLYTDLASCHHRAFAVRKVRPDLETPPGDPRQYSYLRWEVCRDVQRSQEGREMGLPSGDWTRGDAFRRPRSRPRSCSSCWVGFGGVGLASFCYFCSQACVSMAPQSSGGGRRLLAITSVYKCGFNGYCHLRPPRRCDERDAEHEPGLLCSSGCFGDN